VSSDSPQPVPEQSLSIGKHAPDEGQEHALQARARQMQELGEWSAEALAVNDAILSAYPDDLAAQIRQATP
jgi:hypothetical protein